jgi:general secretion pathway protein D
MKKMPNPMSQAMMNKRLIVIPTTLRLTALGVIGGLNLSGCQLLGPSAMTPPVPEIMKIQPVKAEKPKDKHVPENTEITKEFYPPTGGLVGSSGQLGGKLKAKEGKYTLNFDDADLTEVAKVILGDTLKLNYVINPKVTGKVSLQTAKPLADDEMIPTLEMLLRMNGAVLIKSGSLYKIEPEASAAVNAAGAKMGLAGLDAGYQVRVVPVRFVNVQDLQKVIEPLMPPKSVIKADEARNILLLAGSGEELESVMDTVRMFDVDYMRGMSVALYPVKNVDVATLAEEVDKLLGASGKGPMSGMLKIQPIERLNAIMVVTPQAAYLDDVETWIERLDRYNTNKSTNLHVYRVQNVDAGELANTLSQIFGQSNSRGGSRGASVAPGMSGSSVGGGSFRDSNSASPGAGAFGGSGFGGSGSSSSSSGFGGSSSGMGGDGTDSDFDGNSTFAIGNTGTGTGLGSSGIGSGTGSGFGSSGGGFGSSGSGIGGSSGGFGSGSGSGFGSGGGRRGGSRGAQAADLGNNTRIIADTNNNALIIMAKPQAYKEIEAVIKELDILPLQVLIDAAIVEVSLIDDLKYGLKYFFDHGLDKGASVLGSPAGEVLTAAAGGGFTYSLVSHAKDVRVQLDLLAGTQKANVLSTPSVMVLNNQEAQINVGDKVPIPLNSVSNVGSTLLGTNTTANSISYVDSGVTLRDRPHVNSGGLVLMDVQQEISDPSPTTVGQTTTVKFSQRKIHSSVAVEAGETIVMGGLIQNKPKSTIDGLPILSRIPFIGGLLFGQTTNHLERTELVMLLTPRTVENRPDITRITNEFRRRITSFGQLEPMNIETLRVPSPSGSNPSP